MAVPVRLHLRARARRRRRSLVAIQREGRRGTSPPAEDVIIAVETHTTPPERPAAGLARVALLSRCPRCGEGPLFDGFLTPTARCRACGLDTRFVDSGDGPAVFIILIVGFVVVVAALVTEVKVSPPYWVHAVLWLPLTLILSLGLLRPAKALMIALQYRHRAREGRLATPPSEDAS